MAEHITTEAALALANVCNYSPTLGTAEKWLAEAGQMLEALVQERDELKREQSLASEVLADAAAQDAELKLLRGLLKECRPYVEYAGNDAEIAYNDRVVKAHTDALLAQIDLSTKEPGHG